MDSDTIIGFYKKELFYHNNSEKSYKTTTQMLKIHKKKLSIIPIITIYLHYLHNIICVYRVFP